MVRLSEMQTVFFVGVIHKHNKKFCYVALWWHETTQEDCIGKEKQLSHKHPPQRRLQKRPFELNQHLLQPNVSFEMCFLCLHSR